MNCKYCQSENVIKYGTYQKDDKDTPSQLWYCKDCQRKFRDEDTLFHMQKPPNYVTSALTMFYTGSSYGDISRIFEQEYKYKPSKHVLYEWVEKYTTKAVEHYHDERPKVGDTWVADETYLAG